jgi:hypothetical protein
MCELIKLTDSHENTLTVVTMKVDKFDAMIEKVLLEGAK